jgi:hypothetical protein
MIPVFIIVYFMFVNMGIVWYLISRKYATPPYVKRVLKPLETHTLIVHQQPTCPQPTLLPVYICIDSKLNQRRSSRTIDQRRFLQRWLKYMQDTNYKIHVLVPRLHSTLLHEDLCDGMNHQRCTVDLIYDDCLQHSAKDAGYQLECSPNYLLVDSRLAIDISFPTWLTKLKPKTISCLVFSKSNDLNACSEVGYWIPTEFTAYSNNMTLEAQRQGIPINYTPISIIPP